MVVETEYYDKLGVTSTASDLDIKKAYRKLAIQLHPDKNPGDEEANERFQAIGEAYQVLSDPQLRSAYDKHGKEKAAPSSGFEDPSEFFGMVFGGEAFADWIGEISLMKDLTKTMEMSEKFEREEEESLRQDKEKEKRGIQGTTPPAQAAAQDEGLAYPDPDPQGDRKPSPQPGTKRTPADYPEKVSAKSQESNPYAGQRPVGIPVRHALMDRSEEEARLEAAGVTEGEKELRAKERKKGLSKEQRAELDAYEAERRRVREERVKTLAKKLIDRLSVWTETDRGPDVTHAFREKTRLETENLKMESFGLEILHAIGHTYVSKGGNFVKSQNFFGIRGFFSRVKDKGTLVKDVWGTISTAIDAQGAMEEMAKAEEKGGEHWTDEAKAEAERMVTGKILAAAWRGSKFEIQSVLRDVCDQVLHDKTVKMEKRLERGQALILMGSVLKEAKRDDDEEREYMVFEQLMADAARKKEDKEDKKKKDGRRSKEDSTTAEEAGAEAQSKHFGFGTKHEKEKT